MLGELVEQLSDRLEIGLGAGWLRPGTTQPDVSVGPHGDAGTLAGCLGRAWGHTVEATDEGLGLVFVHGFRSTAGVWDPFLQLIGSDQDLSFVKPLAFAYPTKLWSLHPLRRIPSFNDAADSLRQFLAEGPAKSPERSVCPSCPGQRGFVPSRTHRTSHHGVLLEGIEPMTACATHLPGLAPIGEHTSSLWTAQAGLCRSEGFPHSSDSLASRRRIRAASSVRPILSRTSTRAARAARR